MFLNHQLSCYLNVKEAQSKTSVWLVFITDKFVKDIMIDTASVIDIVSVIDIAQW